ncbi:unnamed protein product [Rotaria socialis]|uniref:Peptidase C1A papain C-terminal domain-containing protein n=1 Tax=Rotaria socialis TaxID=392032 RepID=A0A820GCV3_9BILA|nr:unnamed protein product [Rotaria socialis]CAF3469190.1 unnamed protein product [Rotaria socialis]CAF3604437.1 unnamed protein product [Rotaria socialis]CAF4200899.1 unnamed protein product [Rotaria socialis]CAF4261885.1 unnamed protein product [Rotaria socialis]
MPIKTYLLNKFLGRKCRINGIFPSNHLPQKKHLCQAFTDHLIYSPEQLPPKADLRNDMTDVEDQSRIGSCAGNALAGAYEYLTKKQHGQNIDVSRLFIYYNARVKGSGSSNVSDSGCSMTNGIEALEEFGTCLESIWPYDISMVNARPSDQAYAGAQHHKITEALQIKIDLHEMKSCLAQGFPFAFGLRLFTSFDKAATTGVVPMPSYSDRSRQSDGSHALLAVGYSDQSQAFIVRNSWGTSWGDHGYCYIPYDYLTDSNLCFDVWTIRKIPTDDFGQDHWDKDDATDYQNNRNNDDDDYGENRAIEDFDEDDPWTDFGGATGGFRDGTDDGFGFNRGGDDFGFNRGGDDFGFDRGGNDFGFNRGGDDFGFDRGGNDFGFNRGGDDFGFNRGGDDSSVENRGDFAHERHGHHRHHGHHKREQDEYDN